MSFHPALVVEMWILYTYFNYVYFVPQYFFPADQYISAQTECV